jgi:hypothetical protein
VVTRAFSQAWATATCPFDDISIGADISRIGREDMETYMTAQGAAFLSRLAACSDDGTEQAMSEENISNTKATLYKPSSRSERKLI